MELNEKHHAHIIAAFYLELKERGDRGLAVFTKAAQQYGEERGRRMALRALRDNESLGFPAYFAYGEWECTPGFFDMSMKAAEGMVDERVTRCPWASVFADLGLEECGILYCREIDRAIVRGFNPDLCLELGDSMYLDGRCTFCFKEKGIGEDLFERGEASGSKLPMSYHCAHVRDAYSRAVLAVYAEEGKDIIRRTDHMIRGWLGEDSMEELAMYKGEDFTRLP